jgi:predicted acyltransferase
MARSSALWHSAASAASIGSAKRYPGAIIPAARGEEKMRTLLALVGIVLLLAGLVFMGQGSGYFPYPASSFMISQSRWIYYGAGIAVVGLLILIVARR